MTREFAVDLTERVVLTFVGGAVGVLAAAGTDIAHVSVWQGALIAGGASVFSLVKGIVAQHIGDGSPGLKR